MGGKDQALPCNHWYICLFILQRISVTTGIILSDNAFDINIACLFLRSVVCVCLNKLYLCCCSCCLFCFACSFIWNKVLTWLDLTNQNGGLPMTNSMVNAQPNHNSLKDYSLQQINNGDNRRLSINCTE